ncbi:SNARE protein syntaxin 18/UFE1 [Laccaria bicolor S238N-H82]|uniref:SNARE protein syntaxin 18/UFE1 n=1 Tax=Laccaria bicolor (strain S238N-H82 / ATCC MYA-4686) TaxID=486041 RepID=B0CY30_LACBS|nr:SNARE protein syntaxin 18/UFE1 [Laccaria bicolor S238N-H82]EDR12820.1 SNARE protein syntaxin 18/UFE1 [Laccaria bicolor S238N-H82]|eukprot:XP_001877084.1 SNARE protein syntaxin 18/UFE1 [Laccaria bicolor S238N-H82]
MPFCDRTNDFQQTLHDKERALPDAKRRKITKPTETKPLGKEYVTEAYTILNHINTLTRMLSNVRSPYLNVDSRSSPLARQGSRNIDLNQADTPWTSIRHLTNEEREQIDLQARVILTRCSSRIKEMEALEKRRAELVASSVNPLARFLPARLRQDETTLTSDVIAAHHAGMTWYLTRRLTEASQTQKEMQEERVKRQLERTRTLGSSAARDMPPPERIHKSGSWLGGSLLAATIGASSSSSYESSQPTNATNSTYVSDEDEDEEIELSASQILQFEAENANILRTVQDTLESVQQAESRLMDISALQMELVSHLTRQTELTDQLYEDAIATTSTVEKGNVQLKEAKRRAKDGRLFILVFLIGASLSLLFLHYY